MTDFDLAAARREITDAGSDPRRLAHLALQYAQSTYHLAGDVDAQQKTITVLRRNNAVLRDGHNLTERTVVALAAKGRGITLGADLAVTPEPGSDRAGDYADISVALIAEDPHTAAAALATAVAVLDRSHLHAHGPNVEPPPPGINCLPQCRICVALADIEPDLLEAVRNANARII